MGLNKNDDAIIINSENYEILNDINDNKEKFEGKKMVFLGLMVGYSLILYILETYIPNPFIVFFPGAKLGLTNIVTLVSLLIFGFKETFIIVTVRVILSSIFAGPMSYLLFSIGGAYLSLICMYFASKV